MAAQLVRTTKVLLQVRGYRFRLPPVFVTAYTYSDGKTRIPHATYDEVTKGIPRGTTIRVF